jgi:integrase
MPRPSSIWLRSQDNHYYLTFRGKKIKLSSDKKEATRLFHELLAKAEEPAGVSVSPSFNKVADLFLDESQRTKKPTTCRMQKMFLQSACDHFGKKRVADLKVFHVTQWLKTQAWNESSQCSARSTVLACLNWAVNQGYLDRHPLTRLKRGSQSRRERYLTPEERKQIRENVKPDFADFLLALELTGARPFSELATLTAESIDWKTNTVPLGDHKNKNKGKTRTIYLTPPLAELLKRKSDEHPTGPLFRNRRGNPWRSHDATRRLHHITAKLKIEKATIYAFRHAYCTDALAKGMNANILAELVGNSPVTLARTYDHLHKRRNVMLEAAAKAIA